MRASPTRLLGEALALVEETLVEVPDRLAHSIATSRLAREAAGALALDDVLLGAAGALHDIGYAPALLRTGFHPLDGARHLAGLGWPDDVVLLVAHHSHAALLAPYEGVAADYARLVRPPDDLIDVLTWADLTSGLEGEGTRAEQRVAGMRHRHVDRTHIPLDVREARYRLLLRSAASVDSRLRDAGLPTPSDALPTTR